MKNRIKELREQKRISQVCLATHIGCSQNTISKMELEMSEPKASQLLESKRLNFRHGYKNPRPHFCNRSTLIIHI